MARMRWRNSGAHRARQRQAALLAQRLASMRLPRVARRQHGVLGAWRRAAAARINVAAAGKRKRRDSE